MKNTYTLWQRIKAAFRIILFGVPDIKRAEFTWSSNVKIGKGGWKFVATTLVADVLGNWYTEKSHIFTDGKKESKVFGGEIGFVRVKRGEKTLEEYMFQEASGTTI